MTDSITDPGTVRFRTGDRVRVRAAYPIGHVRTPYYIRGRRGIIERICGSFPNPEELAYARAGLPAQPLYRVRFLQRELWPDYAGDPADVLEADIYQHWLQAEDAPR
jgi:nitrile hydratase subunit beta